MRGVNKAIIVGNVGQDPEVRHSSNGNAICNLSVATSESWKDKNTGEQQERTEWHRVVFYRRLAEIVGEYVRKGSQIYVEGRLQTRKWQDQSGQDRYTTEIVADQMQMLGGKRDDSQSGLPHRTQPRQESAPQAQAAAGGFEDDIPFAEYTDGCF